MGKGTILVILAIVIWQVVSGIAQTAAKKQQQGRLKEAAEERRRQIAAQSGPRASRVGAPTRVGGGTSVRVDDLAARRRAQLEELRRRRAAAGTRGATPAQAKIGRPGAGARLATKRAPAPQPKPTRGAIRTVGADLKSIHAAEEAARHERQERLRQELEGEERHHQREAASKAQDARRRKVVETAQRAEPRPAEPRGRRDAKRLAALLSNRETLRDLFLLKEILDGPVTMREPRY